MIPLLAAHPAIRKIICTTNAMESLNRMIRKSIKARGAFRAGEAATRLTCLAIRNVEKAGRNIRDMVCRTPPTCHPVRGSLQCVTVSEIQMDQTGCTEAMTLPVDPPLVIAFRHRVDCDLCAVFEDAGPGPMVTDLDDPASFGAGHAVVIAACRNHVLLAEPPLQIVSHRMV